MKAFILQNEIPQNMHIMSRNEQIKTIKKNVRTFGLKRASIRSKACARFTLNDSSFNF